MQGQGPRLRTLRRAPQTGAPPPHVWPLQGQPQSDAARASQQGARVPPQAPVPQLSRGAPGERYPELRVLEAQVRSQLDRS